MEIFYLVKSEKQNKKYTIIYKNLETDKFKSISFGSAGYSDFLHHKDVLRRDRYILRPIRKRIGRIRVDFRRVFGLVGFFGIKRL